LKSKARSKEQSRAIAQSASARVRCFGPFRDRSFISSRLKMRRAPIRKGNALVAVNIRCLEGVDLSAIPVQNYDGRSL
jgi:hypothetical protein